MGISKRLNRGYNSKTTNCPTSIYTRNLFDLNGNEYSFCLHDIYLKGINMDITEHHNWDPGREKNRCFDPDKRICEFKIDEYHQNAKGIYCFFVNDEPKYIGETTRPFKKRINYGYGHIYPRNCYSDGNGTDLDINYHINEELQKGNTVLIGFYEMDNDYNIKQLEDALIEAYELRKCGWNKR